MKMLYHKKYLKNADMGKNTYLIFSKMPAKMLLLYFRSSKINNPEPKIHLSFSLNFEKPDLFLFLLKEGK